MIASAAATAFFTVAASSAEPTRIFAASCAHNGVSATLVRPIEQVADFAAAHGQHDGGGGGRVVADLALELFVGVAVSGRRHRNADGGEHVAGFQRGEIGALVEFARRDAAFAAFAHDVIGGAKAHHHRRHVVAGIAVGDVAAERAEIAHLRIGDLQRGFAQDRNFRAQQVGADQLMLGRHRADDDIVAVGADAFELGDAGEIDEMRRRREPQLHHRDEAVAAGKRAAVVAQFGEQTDGFLDGCTGDDRRKRLVSWASSLARVRAAKVITKAVRGSAQYRY